MRRQGVRNQRAQASQRTTDRRTTCHSEELATRDLGKSERVARFRDPYVATAPVGMTSGPQQAGARHSPTACAGDSIASVGAKPRRKVFSVIVRAIMNWGR